jgi:hypothetical protein
VRAYYLELAAHAESPYELGSVLSRLDRDEEVGSPMYPQNWCLQNTFLRT